MIEPQVFNEWLESEVAEEQRLQKIEASIKDLTARIKHLEKNSDDPPDYRAD